MENEIWALRNSLLSRMMEATWDQGKYDEAVGYGRQMIENCLKRPEAIPALSRGWPYYHLGRALYMRGNIYHAMGEAEMVQEYYTQAAEIFRKRNCSAQAEQIQALTVQDEPYDS